jgi:hypothetical protein
MPDGNVLHYESVTNVRDNTKILTFGAKTMPGHLNGIKFHDFNTVCYTCRIYIVVFDSLFNVIVT